MSMDIKELRELRIQLGLTMKETGKWLSVSESSVMGWEVGRSKPSSANLFNYKQFLQDVIDGKIKPQISSNAGRNYREEHKQRIIAEPQVTIADVIPVVPKIEMPITPKYYKGKNSIEAIDFIEAFNLNFNCGNVIKYVSRAGKKTENALEDLQKAHWYLEREIERRKKS